MRERGDATETPTKTPTKTSHSARKKEHARRKVMSKEGGHAHGGEPRCKKQKTQMEASHGVKKRSRHRDASGDDPWYKKKNPHRDAPRCKKTKTRSEARYGAVVEKRPPIKAAVRE